MALLEPEFGPDNPFVLGLKMQIASHEKPRAENPIGNRETYHAGMRPEPTQEKARAKEAELFARLRKVKTLPMVNEPAPTTKE